MPIGADEADRWWREQAWSALLAACRDAAPPDELVPAAVPSLSDPELLAVVAAAAADPSRRDVGRAATAVLRQAGPGQRGGPLEVLAVRALATGRGDLAAGLLLAAGTDRPPVLVSVHALAW